MMFTSFRTRIFAQQCVPTFSQLRPVFTMTIAAESQLPKGRGGFLFSLDAAVDNLSLAKETTAITPAKAAFGSASVLLATIRVGFLPAHVGGLLADIYRTL